MQGRYLCFKTRCVVSSRIPWFSNKYVLYFLNLWVIIFLEWILFTKEIIPKLSYREPCWSADESLFALMIGGEAHFYELKGKEGFATSTNKLGSGRNGVLSIAPGQCPPHLAFYVPGAKGAPSMCKIYRYPALQQNQTIACKSFFQVFKFNVKIVEQL